MSLFEGFLMLVALGLAVLLARAAVREGLLEAERRLLGEKLEDALLRAELLRNDLDSARSVVSSLARWNQSAYLALADSRRIMLEIQQQHPEVLRDVEN
jgi:hypothetical protein